jgi:preprotein translocase subunit SecA
MLNLVQKIFGSQNDRELKKLSPLVDQINSLEESIQKLSDESLVQKTTEFKERYQKGESLDDLLPEAFAVVREAAVRVLGMRHYDCQLIGGVVLHQGKIAEMKTGEGKTLVGTLPVYLNALTGKGVHVVTVNDYLASRDAAWMGKLYQFLGLSVGVIIHGLNDQERKEAYNCDITYGTNNEFGFDFLRDNMKFNLESMAQRPHHFAIVDEVDSILIDEARTPLIISGPAERSTEKYIKINTVIPGLEKEKHYQLEEKSHQVMLTDEGVAEVEKRLGVDNLYDPNQIEILHHVNQALKAHTLYKKDVDYLVKDGKVVIVDEFTGRLMAGRRWSDGLHQAVEAKEGVRIENENQTLASITFQNYFRIYEKLAGMTGTADTEAPEFAKIYNLEVMVIPTNKPISRDDQNDVIYKTEQAKFKAVVEDIKEAYEEKRPVLVGTIAVEKSEVLSNMLKRRGVPHNVLNAKQHGREAEIVAQAGRLGSITVSTNMAGRGTDIMLGGNPEFLARDEVGDDASDEEFEKALKKHQAECKAEREEVLNKGGLLILGTERHESRRIDNQLRGRAGRQGDPGTTRFYISLEDDLMRIFGSDRLSKVMGSLGMGEDETIESKLVSRAIENAQKKVEGHNFDIRKNVLEYDDVMNQQRMTIYKKRKAILKSDKITDQIYDFIDQLADDISMEFAPQKGGDEFNQEGLEDRFFKLFGVKLNFDFKDDLSADTIGQKIYDQALEFYKQKTEKYGDAIMREMEKYFTLQILDSLWKDHLLSMDHLREGIGLRGYGQKDPKLEYKKEAYTLFEEMIFKWAEDVIERVFKVQIQVGEEGNIPVRQEEVLMSMEKPSVQDSRQAPIPNQPNRAVGPASRPKQTTQGTITRQYPKVGRNDPCPCNSGKKYKKCHGA